MPSLDEHAEDDGLRNGATARRVRPSEAPRSRHRHRARRGRGTAALATAAWPLAAVAVVALVAARAARRDIRSGEGRLAADALLSGSDGATSMSVLSPDGLGARLVAVYATVTRVFDRYDSLVFAGRELLLLVAVGSALLLWRTARRLGLGVPASTAAVLLAGLPSLLSPAALLDVPAQLAVPWLLLAAWLLAPGRPTRAARGVALAALGIATLLAPDVAVLLLSGLAAALATRATGPRRRWTGALVPVPVLVLVILLLPRWDPQPDAAAAGIGAVALAATTAGFVLAGALGAWSSDRVRVPSLALAVTALGALATYGRFSAAVVCLPVAALVTAAAADEEALRLPIGARRKLESAAAAGLAAGLLVAVVGLVRLPAQQPAADGDAALLGWIEGNLASGDRVVVPQPMWADLVQAGGNEAVLRLPGTGTAGDAPPAALTAMRGKPPADGLVLFRFDGAGSQPLVLVDPSPGVPTAAELARRRSLAAALLANPTTRTGPGAAAVLASAAVDQRLLSLLAALGARSAVGIRDFPRPDGEPDDGPPARRVLVDSLGGAPLPSGAPATERLSTGWTPSCRPSRPTPSTSPTAGS